MNQQDRDGQVSSGRKGRRRAAQAAQETTPIVVGVGASAGSLDALHQFLKSFQLHPGIAVVLVLQHREALNEESLARFLPENMQLSPVRAGEPVEGGRVYLPDPDIILTIRQGRFRTRRAQQPAGERGTMDSFFVSLAEDQTDRAIGVVLQGTAGDGTLGLAALKENGGVSIVEHPPGDGPDLWSPGALADFLLPAAAIPERIAQHARRIVELQGQGGEASADVAGAVGRIAAILRTRTGHDFHGYKQNTFMRRVQRRMQVVQQETTDGYIELLRSEPEEAQNLFNDLLIGVTQFFRDFKEFEVLETQVIPKIVEGKSPGDFIRVWVLGCATGDEAYSIAILLREQMLRVESSAQVQIFATDIDGRALAAARVGRYSESIANDVSPERLARWFIKEGNTYRIAKELREMCIFSAHNVIRDAPFSRLDLVSCRNLLIYLNSELQERVIPLFHFALLPDGYLFLGNSENVTRHRKLFAPIDRRSRIFKRVDTGTRILPDFPITRPGRRGAANAPAARSHSEGDLVRQVDRIVERHRPAYVVVDEDFTVVHFSGRMGPYLDPTSGVASLELLNLIHRDLRLDLRAALHKAAEQNQPVRLEGLTMFGNEHAGVEIVVEPLPERTQSSRSFVVLFKDIGLKPDVVEEADHGTDAIRDEHVRRLEADLRVTRERLQATIEELESTNEELKASNEEYQSLNEELQSANEELETSREELQSVNEELTTVNGELGHRIHELTRATSDLKNFLESTQIATIFLDNDLRVTNYTPAVTEIFHLVETDVGRPITHIKARIPFEELQEDARRVIRTLGNAEREVQNSATGARYIVRILPYRSIDNYIAGVVLTFLDVTQLKEVERQLRASETRFREALRIETVGVIFFDNKGEIAEANDAFLSMCGYTRDDLQSGRIRWKDPTPPDWMPLSGDALAEYSRTGRTTPHEREFVRRDGSRWWALFAARRLSETEGVQYVIDITTRKRAEERQKLLLEELQHRVRNTLAVIRSIARRTAVTSSTVDDYATHLDGRLNAFARVQAAVTRDPAAGVDLEQLVSEELLAYAAREGEQVRISGPTVRLFPKAAETIGLAVHELATNAVKHGSLARPGGQVEVSWRVLDGAVPELHFDWVESGMDNGPNGPARRGFGTELLERTLTYELKARTSLDFSAHGLRCSIQLPLTERVAIGIRPQRG